MKPWHLRDPDGELIEGVTVSDESGVVVVDFPPLLKLGTYRIVPARVANTPAGGSEDET